MDAVRTLRANLRLEGKACGWCQGALKLGEDAAICTTCEKEHHGRCWETRAGCATSGCVNAPLRRLDAAMAGAPHVTELSPGMTACPGCRVPLVTGTLICPTCRKITSADGIYHGPKVNAPGAVQSLVYGIAGLIVCGVIFGPIAISKANAARIAMASDPTLEGEGLATAGKVLGIVDLVFWAILMMSKMASP